MKDLKKYAAANIWVDMLKRGPLAERLWVYDGSIVFCDELHHQFRSFAYKKGGYRAHTDRQILDGLNGFKPFLISTDELGSTKALKEYYEEN